MDKLGKSKQSPDMEFASLFLSFGLALIYMKRPRTVVEPYPNPKEIPLGTQKVKNDLKI